MKMFRQEAPVLIALAIIAAGAISSACAGDSATAGEEATGTVETGVGTEAEDRDAGTIYFAPVAADQSQTDALADGVVTREEYDAAVAGTMACLNEKGVDHTQPVYDGRRYTYTVINSSPIGSQGVTPYDECWMMHERDVQAKWVEQQLGSE